jgi:hypothetical protein
LNFAGFWSFPDMMQTFIRFLVLMVF